MPLISFDTPWKHQKARGMKEISGMKWVNAILFIVHGPDLSVLAINPGVFEKEML